MSSFDTIQHNNNHRQTLDITSEGAIVLIEDLLHSGLAVRIKVGGRSMKPFLKENDIVTIQKVRTGKINKGDIILFVSDAGKPLLHRIVRIQRDINNITAVQTKGDGLVALDAPVNVTRILGYVSGIEVKESTSEGKTTYSRKDLTLFQHRLIASAVARRELAKYYFYRLLAKSPFIRKSKVQ